MFTIWDSTLPEELSQLCYSLTRHVGGMCRAEFLAWVFNLLRYFPFFLLPDFSQCFFFGLSLLSPSFLSSVCTQPAKHHNVWIHLLFLINHSSPDPARQRLKWQVPRWACHSPGVTTSPTLIVRCFENSTPGLTLPTCIAFNRVNTILKAHDNTMPSSQGSNLLTHNNCYLILYSLH